MILCNVKGEKLKKLPWSMNVSSMQGGAFKYKEKNL